jgi:hypothetical protein
MAMRRWMFMCMHLLAPPDDMSPPEEAAAKRSVAVEKLNTTI